MIANGEIGVIQDIHDSKISILFSGTDACETCGLKIVCAPGKTSERVLTFPGDGNFKVGQAVQVEETGNLELHLALIQFGIPILLFISGLLLGFIFPQNQIQEELVSFLGGLLGLLLSFYIAKNLIARLTLHVPSRYLSIKAI